MEPAVTYSRAVAPTARLAAIGSSGLRTGRFSSTASATVGARFSGVGVFFVNVTTESVGAAVGPGRAKASRAQVSAPVRKAAAASSAPGGG